MKFENFRFLSTITVTSSAVLAAELHYNLTKFSNESSLGKEFNFLTEKYLKHFNLCNKLCETNFELQLIRTNQNKRLR